MGFVDIISGHSHGCDQYRSVCCEYEAVCVRLGISSLLWNFLLIQLMCTVLFQPVYISYVVAQSIRNVLYIVLITKNSSPDQRSYFSH